MIRLVYGALTALVRSSGVWTIALYCFPAAVLFFGGCGGVKTKTPPPQQAQEIAPSTPGDPAAPPLTRVEMVNVDIHLDADLILHVHHLSGQFLSTRKGRPPAFDDKLSYIVAIDSAEVGVSPESMSHAMNTYVFAAPDAPLKNLKLSIQGSEIKQTGTLNKGIRIPFEMTGTMSATADGKIRISPSEVKAAHLPVKGVMKLFGLNMAKLIDTSKTKGIGVDGNDIILDPALMLPPPMMRGRITSVTIRGNEIVQTFGSARAKQVASFPGNYMYYRGGVLRFGKLTMNDTDMQLIDADPSDPFDFFPDHYLDQLVAGYSKTTPSGGLRVYMPDYRKLSKASPLRLARGADSGRPPAEPGLH